jgi:glycosyltransferase involved in cell wall biosynthesis
MTIGFDAKRVVQNNTGLGNYSRYIIEIVSEYYPDNDYLLFAPRKKENNRLKTILSRANISFVFPAGISKSLSSLWRMSGIKKDLKKNRVDIFHGLSNELPVGIEHTGIQSVVTVHDLIFLRYPHYYKWVDRSIYRWKFKRACKKADKIIAISECTKRDIISFFSIPEEKIEVIYQGCHPQFAEIVSRKKKQQIMEKYHLPSRFLLYIGSIESRKNLLLVVKALEKLPEDIHLVAIGKSTPYQEIVETYARKSGLQMRLHIKNDFPFEDLPSIYQLASVFIYPSFFEGFGIPVIEALMSRAPVIAATGSCLEEAGGQGSIYVNPNDDVELADRISEVLNNEILAEKMAGQGVEYVKRFDAQNIAAGIMKIYQSLINQTFQ